MPQDRLMFPNGAIRATALAAVLALNLSGYGALAHDHPDHGAESHADPLKAAVEDTARGEAMARDQYRKPYEVLSFFGVEPDMTVVEIWPSGGWYLDILAPYLRDEGYYIAAMFDPATESAFIERALAAHQAKLSENRERYGYVSTTALGPDAMKIAPPESVDMVLTFRNVHSFMRSGYAQDVFTAAYAALKPGGVFGVVGHRADDEGEQDPAAANGYVQQDYAIEMVEQAGFEFVESSEVLANPADTKDYENGVWTLPPTLRTANRDCTGPAFAEPPEGSDDVDCVDQSGFLEIGESDRFVLKFRKPDA